MECHVKDSEESLQPAAVSIPEAGKYLGVSPDTVRRLIHAGDIPHARIGASIRIRRADLDAYLDSQTSTEWRPMAGRGRQRSA
jgi:excisionase family DNA binding protein